MTKTTGDFDSTFWNMQRQAPAKIINVSGGQVIGLQRRQVSRRVKKRLREQSPLRLASVIWQNLEQSQRDDWQTVASGYGLSGWQLFVQRGTEQQQRGPVELGGYSYAWAYYGFGSVEEDNNPDYIALYLAGRLDIAAPADEVIITQQHDEFYNIRRIIPQSKRVFETVEIEEKLNLPLEIATSWRTDLVASGGSPSVEFYATIEYDNDGITDYYKQGFALGLQDGWQRNSVVLTPTLGTIYGYSLSFALTDCIGTLWFDNVRAEHTGTNWALDPHCYNVNPPIVRQHGDIAQPWSFESGASSATLKSEKIDNLSLV